MAYRGIRGSDPFASKTTRNERFEQMSKQEQLIEQKKREIQSKLEDQKKKETEEVLKKLQSVSGTNHIRFKPLSLPIGKNIRTKFGSGNSRLGPGNKSADNKVKDVLEAYVKQEQNEYDPVSFQAENSLLVSTSTKIQQADHKTVIKQEDIRSDTQDQEDNSHQSQASSKRSGDESDEGQAGVSQRHKKRSRWAPESEKVAVISGTLMAGNGVPSTKALGAVQLMGAFASGTSPAGAAQFLSKVTRTDPALVQYAVQAFGTSNLFEDDWKKLSEGIWNKFMIHQQTEDTFNKKMLLWKYLHVFIKSSFPRYRLCLVGSTMNGFGSDNSDVDMCLLVDHAEMDQRNEALGHLQLILKYLQLCEFIEHPELIQAKVPILKFRDTRYCLEVDLSFNNFVGISNTHLLYCYSQMDWRVRPLVLIVKLWAHKHNINDARNMTISSYSLVLMVIHFLQCGVSPPVLPCLHGMYQGEFTPHSDIEMIDIHEELLHFNSDSTHTLGELLHNFLRYYVEFDFSQYAISVRLASRVSIEECRRARTYKNDPHQWKYLCIEEPFDLTNTARSVYDRNVFERVKAVFRASYSNLKKTCDIESIFHLDEKD